MGAKYIPVDMLKLAMVAGCVKSIDDIFNLAIDAEQIYRQVKHDYLIEDAHNFVRDYLDWHDERELNADDITEAELNDYDYEYLVKQYEDNEDCNVAFNDTWESIVNDYMKYERMV